MNPDFSPEHHSQLLLKASTKKPQVLFGISALLVLAGVRVVEIGDPVGWTLVGIFLISAVVWGMEMLPQAHSLRLDSDGIQIKRHFLTSRFRWLDIREFGVLEHDALGFVGGSASVYMKIRMPSLSEKEPARQFSLPSEYGLSAGTLAEVLREWHKHFGMEGR